MLDHDRFVRKVLRALKGLTEGPWFYYMYCVEVFFGTLMAIFRIILGLQLIKFLTGGNKGPVSNLGV